MNTKPLNYCRDMVASLAPLLDKPDLPQRIGVLITTVIAATKKSQKFLLPDYGRLMDDVGLKALDDDVLHLPFQTIALEYHYPIDPTLVLQENESQCSKRILLASQSLDAIVIWRVQYMTKIKCWVAAGPVALPLSKPIDRSKVGSDGRCCVGIVDLSGQTDFDPVDWADSFADDAWVLLSFLNALACSNVQTRVLPKPAPISGRQAKKNPPHTDVYHILTVPLSPAKDGKHDGIGHGSAIAKREHLRRGHIRRLSDTKKIWVNAAVVNAGRGFGRVTKDYEVKPS